MATILRTHFRVATLLQTLQTLQTQISIVGISRGIIRASDARFIFADVVLVLLDGVEVVEVQFVEFALPPESNQNLNDLKLGICMPRSLK